MTDTTNDFEARCRAAGVHTVEVGAPDTQGHLRGKRVPIDRYFETTVEGGVNIADAMFVFDMQNDLVDNPYINLDSGFLDCKLVPDVSTGRTAIALMLTRAANSAASWRVMNEIAAFAVP